MHQQLDLLLPLLLRNINAWPFFAASVLIHISNPNQSCIFLFSTNNNNNINVAAAVATVADTLTTSSMMIMMVCGGGGGGGVR